MILNTLDSDIHFHRKIKLFINCIRIQWLGTVLRAKPWDQTASNRFAHLEMGHVLPNNMVCFYHDVPAGTYSKAVRQ